MPHVSLITIGVADVERSTRFYQALGWRRSNASVEGTVAFLEGGAVVLSLYSRSDFEAEAGVTFAASGAHPLALAMNVDSAEAVDTVLGAAAAAGGTITAAGKRMEWGGYSGYFADPDGHLWEVAHNPTFELLPDGRIRLPEG